MILLQVKGLSKHFGVKRIFEDVSFIIQPGDKIGFVGSNGTGKTTLLKCITGVEPFDSGEVVLSQGINTGYLEQLPQYESGVSLLSAILEAYSDVFLLKDRMTELEKAMGQLTGNELDKTMEAYSRITDEYEKAGGFTCETFVRRVVHGLGFSETDLSRDINGFSGGERTRAGLARLLVREPDILLLDEPTNHLDLSAIEWLENYLRGYSGSVLVVSHDRYFLDRVTNKTLEMEQGSLTSYSGNFSRYQILKKEQVLAQTRAFEKQQKEIKETEEYINKYRAGIKSKQARGRQSQLNRLERLEGPVKEVKLKLGESLNAVASSGNEVLNVEGLGFAYEEKPLFDDVNFQLRSGDKTALIGGNGAGKSTLLKILMGQIHSTSGTVKFGSRVTVGYFDQEHSGLNPDHRVIDELIYNFGMSDSVARDRLAVFMFREDDVFKPVKSLSGGEKGRLSFLKLFIEQPNFLILDEPTNHLDMYSKNVIEEFLENFPGTIFAVSHDRYFLDRVTNKTLELEKGRLTAYQGNYSYYKEKKEQLQREAELLLAQNEKSTVAPKEIKKPTINKAKTREQIAGLEREIEKMEERLGELSALLADPDVYQDGDNAKELVREYSLLEEKIPQIYEEWERLSELLNA